MVARIAPKIQRIHLKNRLTSRWAFFEFAMSVPATKQIQLPTAKTKGDITNLLSFAVERIADRRGRFQMSARQDSPPTKFLSPQKFV